MNIQDAAIQILKDAGKPLHANEIAKLIIDAELWKSDSKTPEATVSARLHSDIKSNEDKSQFVKVGPQIFASGIPLPKRTTPRSHLRPSKKSKNLPQ